MQAEVSRRVRVALVSPSCILDLFALRRRERSRILVPTFPDLPADARIASVHYDHLRNIFCFAVEHESFDEAEPGRYPPETFMQVECETIEVRAKTPGSASSPDDPSFEVAG